MNRVENEAEFVPWVARSADVEVPLSLADPTLGSVAFYEDCQLQAHRRHHSLGAMLTSAKKSLGLAVDLSYVPNLVLCDIQPLQAPVIPYRGIQGWLTNIFLRCEGRTQTMSCTFNDFLAGRVGSIHACCVDSVARGARG